MKRMVWHVTLTLLLVLSLCVPAMAAEYGVIYDETEFLWSEELERLGTEVLPAFTKTYDIDLRVDILTTLSDHETIEDAAAAIYEGYGYGGENGGNGMSLTLLVSEDIDGYALESWYAYFGGESGEWMTNAPWNIPEVYEILTEDNWLGDLEEDSRVLTEAVDAMVDGLEGFVLAGGVADTIWSPAADGQSNSVQSPIVTTGGATGGPNIADYVLDLAGILTPEECRGLNAMAEEVSDIYDVGVYIAAVQDYRDYVDIDKYDMEDYSDVDTAVFDAAVALYQEKDLGRGEDQEGILLMLSMNDRDYYMVIHGDWSEIIFPQDVRESMVEHFLDDFADNRWYDGFADYVTVSEAELALGPEKREDEISAMILSIFMYPAIIAGIVIFIMGLKMKSVATATRAGAYVVDGLTLTESWDRYTHTTQTSRKKESSSSSGGGTSSRSSGGFSGTGGKF